MHTRTLVREYLVEQLIRRGAWESAVYADRVTPIDEDDTWPNICIYTQTERTKEANSDFERLQELTLLVEVRERRGHDLVQAGQQAGNASKRLDDACEAVERIVFECFNNTRRNLQGVDIHFDPIAELNTEISRSAEGEVPYMLAQIEFKVCYRQCFEVYPPESCPLEYVFGDINHVTCNPDDPLNQKLAVALSAKTIQPELGAC